MAFNISHLKKLFDSSQNSIDSSRFAYIKSIDGNGLELGVVYKADLLSMVVPWVKSHYLNKQLLKSNILDKTLLKPGHWVAGPMDYFSPDVDFNSNEVYVKYSSADIEAKNYAKERLKSGGSKITPQERMLLLEMSKGQHQTLEEFYPSMEDFHTHLSSLSDNNPNHEFTIQFIIIPDKGIDLEPEKDIAPKLLKDITNNDFQSSHIFTMKGSVEIDLNGPYLFK